MAKRPNGYLRDFENIRKELESLIKKLKHFPTPKELCKLGFNSLSRAITRYHGGFAAVQEALGYAPKRKAAGYYRDFDRLSVELENISRENEGEFPSYGLLIELERQDLIHGVREHGGLVAVREKMGYRGNKGGGYWHVPKNILQEAKSIFDKGGHLPPQRELQKMRKSSLSQAIVNHYPGGFAGIRRDLGDSSTRKPHGYWKDRNNVEIEIVEIMKRHSLDKTPSQEWLGKNGYSTVGAAISTYHGGMVEFRKSLGEKGRVKNNAWKDREYAVNEAIRILAKENLEELPSEVKLLEMGYGGLVHATQRYYGGLEAFRALLRERLGKVPLKRLDRADDFKDRSMLAKKLEEIRANYPELNEEIPSAKWLQENGYLAVYNGIKKHHGGMICYRGYRESLGIPSEKQQLETFLEGYVEAKDDRE